MIVKVCGMRDSENVRAVCSLRPDLVGFIFVRRSKRFVGEMVSQDLFAMVPEGVERVAVFADESLESLLEIVKRFNFKTVQLHGSESGTYRRQLKAAVPGVQVMQAVSGGNIEALDFDGVDLFLFDSNGGGTGEHFDWSVLDRYEGTTPFMIAGGIGAEDVSLLRKKFKEDTRFIGIDVNSKVELSPGFKDLSKVEAVLKEARV